MFIKEYIIKKALKRRLKMFIKEHVITQIQKDFGYTRKQAVDYYNKIDDECRKEFDTEFEAEARKSFYED